MDDNFLANIIYVDYDEGANFRDKARSLWQVLVKVVIDQMNVY